MIKAILLSQKDLSSRKYVKDFIGFLVHQLNPLWGELGKLENEVPFIFRVYRYPFQINKSTLYATGSTHSHDPHLWLLFRGSSSS